MTFLCSKKGYFIPTILLSRCSCQRLCCKQGFLQVARQLFGSFSYFEQFFFVWSNFLDSEQFLQLSSNSEISKQLLVLKLTFLSYFTTFQQTIYEFPIKQGAKSDKSWAQDKSSRADRSAVFGEDSKWWTKIHTRLSEEGHSTTLSAHYIFFGFN